jgi:hypothetical protein
MTDSDLPKEVRDLVIRQLHSMEEIELLLVLAGETHALTRAEIRTRLRLPPSNAPLPSLDRLLSYQFVIEDDTGEEPRYRYAVTDAATRRAIEMLGVAYNERPVTLVRLVYNRPSQAQNFADAFRLTRDSGDDR